MTERECRTCGEQLANIVDLVTHDCDAILHPTDLSRRERNTLMYVETRVVDHAGKLDPRSMNNEDYQNLKVFHAAEAIEYDEPEPAVDPREERIQVTKFTDAAWRLASECRQMRAASWNDTEMNVGNVPGEDDG